MKKKGTRPLAGAANLQQKLTRIAQAQHSEQPAETGIAEEAAPATREEAPKKRRSQKTRRSGSQGQGATRSRAKQSDRPDEIETMLAQGRTDEAVGFMLKALAENDAGSRHVQVKMPAWLHREWSVYVATQGREVREVLLAIILETLAQTYGNDDE